MRLNTLPKYAQLFLSRFEKRSCSEMTPSLIQITDLPAPSTGHIRIISLNRPAALNAISWQLLRELRRAVDQIHLEYDQYDINSTISEQITDKRLEPRQLPTTRALIIASEIDSCFCAGADLKERQGFSANETASFLYQLRSTFTSLSQIPIPSISAISSVALGGGLELALCTQMRVLASIAEVGLPETRLGIIPGAGGTYRLPTLIGRSRAKDLILTGRRISGEEAYFLGIANRLVDIQPLKDESKADLFARARVMVLKRAVSLAEEICQGGPLAIRAALKALDSGKEEVENQMYERIVGTNDRNEALLAFKEKRKPVFTGS